MFKANDGLSIVEVVVAIAFFTFLFISSLRVYLQSNLPIQAMIRDYAVVINICDRYLKFVAKRVKDGGLEVNAPETVDVTQEILDDPTMNNFLEFFAGGLIRKVINQGGSLRKAVALTVNFRAMLVMMPQMNDNLVMLRLTVEWSGRDGADHSFVLSETVTREKTVFFE